MQMLTYQQTTECQTLMQMLTYQQNVKFECKY